MTERTTAADEVPAVETHTSCTRQATHGNYLADQVRAQADIVLMEDGDLAHVETLLKAAGVLLDLSGGRDNMAGMWLLTTEALLSQKRGDTAKERCLQKQAYDKSLALFGESDLCTLACQGNYAQALIRFGDAEGKPLLLSAIEKLRRAEPTRILNQGWIDGAISEFTETLAEVD